MLNQRQDVESTLIQCLFNFWLQERLSLPVLCVHGDDDEHGYECSYLEPIEGRSGWFSIEQNIVTMAAVETCTNKSVARRKK